MKFDVARFGADYAYTMDGGEAGELEFENFNAASAVVRIQGRNVHPGYAKGKMLNAILIGQELISLLPVGQRPEYTQDYEGFFHIVGFKGTVEESTLTWIIRDHDRKLFESKKARIQECCDFINSKYGAGTANPVVKDQYYNMREMVEPLPEHLRRRPEFPRQIRVDTGRVYGKGLRSNIEHRETLR